MPFKSEKQRRYLWAKHPDIARKWADKYTSKDLPMYAHDTDKKAKEKRAVLQVLERVLINSLQPSVNFMFPSPTNQKIKKADSKLEHVKMPQYGKPTYSGEKSVESILKPETEDEGSVGDVLAQEPQIDGAKELLRKIALVAAPEVAREAERRKAQQTGQNPQPVPNNVNVKQYPAPSNVPPPMGMTAPPAPQPAPPQPAQPQGTTHGQLPPVGGGSAPNANPINSMGGLSTDPSQYGTPNAAFGTANAVGSTKQSQDDILGEIMSIDGSLDPTEQLELDEIWLDNLRAKCAAALKQQKCSCGCGQKVAECTCAASCSCRQKGGSCYGLKLEKAAGKPGLWANINAKRKRGEKPAKPGDKDYPDAKSWEKTVKSSSAPAWQRSAGKNDEGGLNEKGRKSYEREHGGNLKAPVTESKPAGERAKRQNSFCSRMCGMKRVNTGAETKSDPDSRINKSLRKWNCKCGSALEFGQFVGHELRTKEGSAKLQFLLNGFGGGRYQFGEGGIAPEVGYKNLFGVVPFPFVGLRIGNKKHGLNIRGPWPSINYSDATVPHDTIWNSHRSHASGWMGEKGRSLWGLAADGFKEPDEAFAAAADKLRKRKKTDPANFENLLRYYGYGQDSERAQQFAAILAARAKNKNPDKLNDMARDIANSVEAPSSEDDD